MNREEQMKNYMQATIGSTAGVAIFLIVVGVMALPLVAWAGMFFLAIGGILLFKRLGERRRYTEIIERIRAEGKLEALGKEFAGAIPVLDDGMRLGENIIFPKQRNTMVAYADITRVYQVIHRINFIENGRELRVQLTSGKEQGICVLKSHGKDDKELIDAVAVMLRKNPAIKVGNK